MSKNICPRCRRLVFQPEEKSAFGKVWHSFCFSCYVCNKLLDCTNAQIAKEDLYCADCYFKSTDDDDDQCPSERCIQSISSRVKSTDDLKVRYVPSDNRSNTKTSEVIYPCSIPVPHSISAWYNRQHRKRLPPTKQVFCVPSCESCNSSTARGYKGGQESECTCSPSSSPVNQENKPDTASEASAKSKRFVSFEYSRKEQRPKTPEYCQSKTSASASERNEKCDECCGLKQEKLSSTSQNADCYCSNFKPIAAIKKALQQSVMASSEPKYYCLTGECYGSRGVRRVKSGGRHISLGGGLDCRRCGRKVYFAEMFSVPGAVYHDTCFCCLDCRKPLEVTTVYPTQGDIYCKLCYIRNFGPLGYGYGLGSGVLLSPNP